MKQLLMLGLMAPLLAQAYSSGPPDGRTGAPGEGNCTQCHSGTVNSGDGSFLLDGPAVYEPGETYTLTATLQDPGQSRWGFELTDQGTGTLDTIDGTTQVSGGQYIKQTSSGTFNGTDDGPVAWSFEWTAPEAGTGDVGIFAAGNAANGNGGTSGDFIYLSSITIEESTALGEHARPASVLLLENAPNPFNPTTELRFELAQGGPVQLEIYDLGGRMVNSLLQGLLPAGTHAVAWDGRSSAGNAVPSGVYLARLVASGEQRLHRMTLLK